MSRNGDFWVGVGCFVYVLYILLYLGMVGAVIYVAIHFIGKYW